MNTDSFTAKTARNGNFTAENAEDAEKRQPQRLLTTTPAGAVLCALGKIVVAVAVALTATALTNSDAVH
jgi:hypothetical protein